MNKWTDERAHHTGDEVTKGEKRGLNLWIYQYLTCVFSRDVSRAPGGVK